MASPRSRHGDDAHDGDEGEQQGVLDEGCASVVVAVGQRRSSARCGAGCSAKVIGATSERVGSSSGSAHRDASLEARRLSRTAHFSGFAAFRDRPSWQHPGPWTPTTIATDLTDRVLTITLDRPDRLNAFTVPMQRELCAVLDEVDANPEIRVVVVTGRGRGFCAGADLGGRRRLLRRRAPAAPPPVGATGPHRDEGGLLTLRIFQCTKPVIAAINGPAVGVGATMTLPMDIRLASETRPLRVRVRPARPGARGCSSWFLPRVVGINTALEWTITGRVFDAQEALDRGLVRSVHAPDDLLPAAYELAAEIASTTSAVSVAMTRQMLWRMLGEPHPMAAHRVDSPAIASLGRSARRPRRRDVVPREAPAAVHRPGPRRPPAPPWPWWEEPEFSR